MKTLTSACWSMICGPDLDLLNVGPGPPPKSIDRRDLFYRSIVLSNDRDTNIDLIGQYYLL